MRNLLSIVALIVIVKLNAQTFETKFGNYEYTENAQAEGGSTNLSKIPSTNVTNYGERRYIVTNSNQGLVLDIISLATGDFISKVYLKRKWQKEFNYFVSGVACKESIVQVNFFKLNKKTFAFDNETVVFDINTGESIENTSEGNVKPLKMNYDSLVNLNNPYKEEIKTQNKCKASAKVSLNERDKYSIYITRTEYTESSKVASFYYNKIENKSKSIKKDTFSIDCGDKFFDLIKASVDEEGNTYFLLQNYYFEQVTWNFKKQYKQENGDVFLLVYFNNQTKKISRFLLDKMVRPHSDFSTYYLCLNERKQILFVGQLAKTDGGVNLTSYTYDKKSNLLTSHVQNLICPELISNIETSGNGFINVNDNIKFDNNENLLYVVEITKRLVNYKENLPYKQNLETRINMDYNSSVGSIHLISLKSSGELNFYTPILKIQDELQFFSSYTLFFLKDKIAVIYNDSEDNLKFSKEVSYSDTKKAFTVMVTIDSSGNQIKTPIPNLNSDKNYCFVPILSLSGGDGEVYLAQITNWSKRSKEPYKMRFGSLKVK